MSLFDSVESAEAAYTKLLKLTFLTGLNHQLLTAQMIGTVNGMVKYINDTPDDKISPSLYTEYRYLDALVNLRLKEFNNIKRATDVLKLPCSVALDVEKAIAGANRIIAEQCDKTYHILKTGTAKEVSDRIMDMINQNKDRMGLDTETDED